MSINMSSAKLRPSCLSLNVLNELNKKRLLYGAQGGVQDMFHDITSLHRTSGTSAFSVTSLRQHVTSYFAETDSRWFLAVSHIWWSGKYRWINHAASWIFHSLARRNIGDLNNTVWVRVVPIIYSWSRDGRYEFGTAIHPEVLAIQIRCHLCDKSSV